jgi:hypothetical protein
MITDNKPTAESWDYAELLESTYQHRPWVVEGLFTEATQVLFIGPSNIGKSIWLQQLIHTVSNGEDFLGMHVPKARKMLYLQSEGDLAETTLRGREMSKLYPPPPVGMVKVEYLLRGRVNTPEGRQALRDLCERFEMDDGVVIIDSLYPTIRGSMSDDSVASDYVSTLNEIIHDYNSAVIVAHHEHRPYRNTEGRTVKEETGKAFFGSFVWEAWTSFGLQIGYTKGRNAITIVNWKRRRPTFLQEEPLSMHMVEPSPLGFVIPEHEDLTRMDSAVLSLLKHHGDWMSKADMVDILSKDRKTKRQTQVQDAVAHLLDLDMLDLQERVGEGRGRPSMYYRIRQRGGR